MLLIKEFCHFVESQRGASAGKGLAISLLLFSLCVQGSLGATYTVYPDHGEFGSIQSAINTAGPGDTILIASGTYAENLKVDRRLTLKGLDPGSGSPVLNGGGEGAVMVLSADGIRIESLTIVGGGSFDGITVTSRGNTLISNTIKNCGKGIELDGSSGNTVEDNRISECSVAGISLSGSGGNSITRNTVSRNSGYGIILGSDSSSNQIFLNTFSNPMNGYASSSADWSSAEVLSYQYNGQALSGELGNYWSDYSGKDGDGDGIGDTPYTLDGGKEGSSKQLSPQSRRDRYPLIQPWETYLATPRGIEPTPSVSPTPTIAPTPSPSLSPTPGESVSPTTSAPTVTPTANASETFPPASGRPVTAATAPFIYLGILGGTALLLSLVFVRDARVSATQKIVRSGSSLWALSGGHALLGLYLLIAPFTYLGTLLAPSEKGIELAAGIAPVSLVAYLALSSFALAYGAAFERDFHTIGRIHLVLSLIAAVALLILAWIVPSTGSIFIPLTSGLLLLSGGLSFWQQEMLLAGTEESKKIIPTEVTSSTLPAGFASSDTQLVQEQQPPERPNHYFPQELMAKYTDISFLGKGGIARVFRARRVSDGREVAVKLPISFDELTGISFLKEIKAWEELRHENIVQ
ncbi:MAG TPA: NosD domain-containing protein, partial [Methanomicrobiales archaeon]|nr:NosD domain-containing protein [Methanomicrobiales archaeon]